MPQRLAVWRKLGEQTRINFWLIMSVLALAAAVFYFNYQGRVALWEQNVDNCNNISVPGSLAAAERDHDLSFFASTAADARRAEGQDKVADKYDEVAINARRRANQATTRAAIPCTERFPKPKVLAGGNANADTRPVDPSGGQDGN